MMHLIGIVVALIAAFSGITPVLLLLLIATKDY